MKRVPGQTPSGPIDVEHRYTQCTERLRCACLNLEGFSARDTGALRSLLQPEIPYASSRQRVG
eukprot:5852750-Amphidinium_carterae.2